MASPDRLLGLPKITDDDIHGLYQSGLSARELQTLRQQNPDLYTYITGELEAVAPRNPAHKEEILQLLGTVVKSVMSALDKERLEINFTATQPKEPLPPAV